MTVKIYVGQDSNGKTWKPGNPHETEAVQFILAALWMKFHHQQDLYAVLVNLNEPSAVDPDILKPSADMVIVTEHGLGVLELKDLSGKIVPDEEGHWCADRTISEDGTIRLERTIIGKDSKHQNPHRQVQYYSEIIRRNVLQLILPKYIQSDPSRRNEVKFQTAVCFTNQLADFTEIKDFASKAPAKMRKRWESRFSILSRSEVADWAFRLSFQIRMDERKFEPHRLSPGTVVKIATQGLGGIEWKEIMDLMPTPEPYGYLIQVDNGVDVQTFNLLKDETAIGRNADKCDVVVNSERYGAASRVHAKIIRSPSKIAILDTDSKLGTFVNGTAIAKNHDHQLFNGDVITLGGSRQHGHVSAFRFVLRGKGSSILPPTNANTSSQP